MPTGSGRIALLLSLAWSAAGCVGLMDTVLPPHSQSLDGVTGVDEVVKVTTLSLADIQASSELRGAYLAAFGAAPDALTKFDGGGEEKFMPTPAYLGSTILKYAGTALAAALEEEAERYAADWKWEGQAFKFAGRESFPFGIKVERRTKNTSNAAGPASFSATFGLHWVAATDEAVSSLKIALLEVHLHSTKAKVLDWKAWTWIPPLIVATILQDRSDAVDVVLSVTAAIATKEMDPSKAEPKGSASFELARLSIDTEKSKARHYSDQGYPKKVMTVDWSSGPAEPKQLAFSVFAAEADSINAGRYLKRLAERIEDRVRAEEK